MGFIVLESESVAIMAGITATSRQASRAGVSGYMPLPYESSFIIKTGSQNSFPHWGTLDCRPDSQKLASDAPALKHWV